MFLANEHEELVLEYNLQLDLFLIIIASCTKSVDNDTITHRWWMITAVDIVINTLPCFCENSNMAIGNLRVKNSMLWMTIS